MKQTISLLILSGAVLLSGCSDPSDKVSKASTSDATAPAGTNTAIMAAPAAPAASADARDYVLQPESKVEFTGSKVTGSHNGGFKTFETRLKVAGGKVVGASPIKIDMKSIWSDNDRLTGHLKSPDFFDVEKFPTSTFTVTGIEGEGAATKVTGNLELHGVTKTVSFPAQVSVSGDIAAVKAEFAINRKDFGILYPGKTDDLIRDNVVIRLDLKAVPAKG